jgi:copper chaperone CopZ
MGCRASVEAYLRLIPGILHVHVDLITQSARVVFAPALTDVATLREALVNAGYAPGSQVLAEDGEPS